MRPDPLLMGAYYRRRGEDRVTEILATVLDGTPQYVAEIAGRVGLSRPVAFEVETQVAAPGCIVDLQIRAKSAAGGPGWLLWSEHKLHSPFSTKQLTKLAHALRAEADGLSYRLMAVTLHEPPRAIADEAQANDVRLLRWRDLIGSAHRAGVALGGAAWRTGSSSGPDEHARRSLLEWLAFCAQELEETLVEPLTTRGIEIMHELEPTFDTLEHLLVSGLRAGCEAVRAGPPREKKEYWAANPPMGTWLAEHGCVLYARYDTDDSWTAAPRGEPIFIAGMWAEGDAAGGLRSRTELLERLEDGRFSFWNEGTGRAAYLDVSLTLPMSEVVANPSIEGQERVVAQHCERAFRELLEAQTA